MAADDQHKVYGALFLEIAIVEHLLRNRMELVAGEILTVGQYGVLNHLKRRDMTSEAETTLAWNFQDDEAKMAAKIDALVADGLVLADGETPTRTIHITPAGDTAHQNSLNAIQREIRPLVEGLEVADVKVALSVLQELRRTLDNLPDR